MSKGTSRNLITLALLASSLLFMSNGLALAGTESTSDPWLFFTTGEDTAAYKGTDYENDSLLVIPFGLYKSDATSSDTITSIETRIIYDSDVLTLVSVDVNGANWPYSFAYSDTVAGDTSYVYMLFNDTTGVGIVAPSSDTVMATMTFMWNCNGNLGDRTMEFRKGTNLNLVHLESSGNFEPGTFVEHDAILTDYWCNLSIKDSAVFDAIGDTIVVPLWMHNNFKSYFVTSILHYDTAALDYVGPLLPDGATFDLFYGSGGDSVTTTCWQYPGFYGYDTENILLYHRFVVDCDAWNDTLTFRFADSTDAGVFCLSVPLDLETDDGDFAFRDTAHYSVSVVETEPRHYNDTITYDIKLTNSFSVGDITGSDGDTAGVVVNVDLGTFMEYEGVTSQHAEMAFQGHVDNDYKVSMFQVVDDGLDNTMPAGDNVTMMRMKTYMNSAPTPLPTWTSPYITGPSFVEFNDAAYDTAVATGTVCAEGATYANDLLSWDDFPNVPAAVCLFYNFDDTVTNGFGNTVDIWVKTNAETDSIHVTLIVEPDSKILSDQEMTGIVATESQANNDTLTLESDGSFAGLSEGDSALIATVLISCDSYPGSGDPELTYSNVWAENDGDRLFADVASGDIVVDCSQLFRRAGESYDNDGAVPENYVLHQNHPNPFNPTTQIQLDLPEAAAWRIEIYNMLGQLVDDFEGYSGVGTVTIEWDASNHATGVYLYRAVAGDYVETKKMLLLK